MCVHYEFTQHVHASPSVVTAPRALATFVSLWLHAMHERLSLHQNATKAKTDTSKGAFACTGSHCACCLHDSPLSTVVIAQSKARVTILGSQRRRGRGFGTLTVSSDD